MKSLEKVVASVVLISITAIVSAQAKVTLAIGGASCLCYLPTVLADQLGNFKRAGVDVDMVNFKGGSQALMALIDGKADVVSGYYDQTVAMAGKGQQLQSFVVYDRFPGLTLVVAPDQTGKIGSIRGLAGKQVGISAPGSWTDFLLKYLLNKDGLNSDAASVVGIGVGGSAIAAMERGSVAAAVMVDPAVTILKAKYEDLVLLADTRTQKGTRAVFGGDYPGGAFYTHLDWIKAHPKEPQAMVNALVATLRWIHSHTAEQIVAKMPPEMVGHDKASYLAALGSAIPMYSKAGLMEPKGPQAVLDVFRIGSPALAKMDIDLTRTYTNEFVEKADAKR